MYTNTIPHSNAVWSEYCQLKVQRGTIQIFYIHMYILNHDFLLLIELKIILTLCCC